MAWIETKRRKDGTISYWLRDRCEDGRQVVRALPECKTMPQAQLELDKYLARLDLEKEGYDGLA